MKTKTHAEVGMDILMKSPASPTTQEGLKAFKEMKKASGLSTQAMLEYIGKKSRMPKKNDEKQKQETRLDILNSDK